MKFYSKTFLPIRSHLLSDGAKSPLQSFIENALYKARQLFLGVVRKEAETPHNISLRPQFRVKFDFPIKQPQQTLPQKATFISLRPGFIQRIISKWPTNSLAAAFTKEASRKAVQKGNASLLCFVGYTLAKKPSILTDEEELEGVSYEIRDAFSFIPFKKTEEDQINKLDNVTFEDLKIGELIAKGCNAAVYGASWKNKQAVSDDVEKENISISKTDNIVCPQKVIISHSEGISEDILIENTQSFISEKTTVPFPTGNLDPFDLAVKVMFNYSAESNAFAIWKAMHKEMLPVIRDFSHSQLSGYKISQKKHLPPHPNIAEMYLAFADQLPLLPGAFLNYPQALPTRLSSDGCGRNMTLFLVMKRYHCSLKDYLKNYKPSVSTSLLLFTQLLEATVHLLQNNVAHRDLKADNILLDVSHGMSSPVLAVTDFGCSSESLQVPYSTYDVDKGGNTALMAPEIVNAEPGAFSTLDYSRSDLWTSGALAYEIFGSGNPFYATNSPLRNSSYSVADLPPLPPHVPAVLQKLVKDLLHPNPHFRPRQNLAATVCQLLLHAPPELLTGPSSKKTYTKVFHWMFHMAAKTYLEASVQPTTKPSLEFQLRYTFCSRIQFSEVLEAVRYILDA